MEKKDKITLLIFVGLIIAIISVFGINAYKNRKLTDVERKVEYIMGYSYNTILNKGSNLFLQTVELINNKNVFEYEKNLDESIKYFSINKINNYIKINNFSIAINTLSEDALKEYMKLKKIINFENNYYLEDVIINKTNYIGSSIDIDNYNDDSIYFKSVNYYCDNENYKGIIYEEPKCNYTKDETIFSIILENNMFKINNIKDFDFLK